MATERRDIPGRGTPRGHVPFGKEAKTVGGRERRRTEPWMRAAARIHQQEYQSAHHPATHGCGHAPKPAAIS